MLQPDYNSDLIRFVIRMELCFRVLAASEDSPRLQASGLLPICFGGALGSLMWAPVVIGGRAPGGSLTYS